MRQINLRLPDDLRKKAEKFVEAHGYKNIQELAKESMRMKIEKAEMEGENFWKELPLETRKGIEEIGKLPKSEWKRW